MLENSEVFETINSVALEFQSNHFAYHFMMLGHFFIV